MVWIQADGSRGNPGWVLTISTSLDTGSHWVLIISTSLHTGSHCFLAVDSPFSGQDPGKAAASSHISVPNSTEEPPRLVGITYCHKPLYPPKCKQ